VAVFILAFAVLGLLLGIAASQGAQKETLPENIEDRDPEVQERLFNECIEAAQVDGTVTDNEYNNCAYSIYD
jgi:hypothetical protein